MSYSKASNISNVYYRNYMKTRIESDDDLALEKTLNNTIIFIDSIFNNKYNHYQHDVYLIKYSYKLAE